MEPPTPVRSVLVTGASTGIGRSIAERLAARGFQVYAGARKRGDLDALMKIPGVRGVQLDVTEPADVEAVRRLIEFAGKGLFALVNNAGILTSGDIASTDLAELKRVMDVNVFGPWRLVQAFAELLRSARGRIVNISSVNGLVVNPGYGAYCMSKHALEAFSDALAEELALSGVQVSAIEPGSFRTHIVRNLFERTGIGAEYLDYAERSADPGAVAAAVELALHSPTPKLRYLVAPNEAEARFAIEGHLQRLIELNDGQSFEFDRPTLIAMLDAALQRANQGIRFSREWPSADLPPLTDQ